MQRSGHRRKHSWFEFLKSPDRRRIKVEVDAEKLTSEERMSRMLHTPKPKAKLASLNGPLYDHFVVVGLDSVESTNPSILYSYPPMKDGNIYPGIEDFCFPNGVELNEIPESTCKSSVLQLHHYQSNQIPKEHFFVFLFSNEYGHLYYGMCIHKEEIFEEPLSVVKLDVDDIDCQKYLTTRCYCVVSRFPYFRLHIEFMLELFAMDHLYRLEKNSPTIEDDEEDKVFLGVKQKQLSTKFRSVRGQSSPGILRSKSDKTHAPSRSTDYNTLDTLTSIVALVDENTNRIPDALATKVEKVETSDFPLNALPKPDVHPILDALIRYRAEKLPAKGLKLTFQISQYLNPIHFRRPFFDEEEELYAEWGLPLAFFQLSFKTIIQLLSAILLERKVVIYCKNHRYLSSLILAIPPLIRPFRYQSVMIPLLPQKLPSLLEAPVPFLIGVTKLDKSLDIPTDVIILDVRKDSLKSSMPLPLLPNSKELYPFFFHFIYIVF